MIIGRYLIKETLKTQIAILFVLLLIFFSQKLIRILSLAIDGTIPNNLIIPLLILGMSSILDIILPLSLFLGILITFGRLYMDSEMVAMQACGIKKQLTYRVVALLCIITCLFTTINSLWFGPWSSTQEKLLRENAKLNPSITGLLAGKFQQSPDGSAVVYVGGINQNGLSDVFIAQLNPKQMQRPAIIVADKGHFGNDKEGNQIIVLNDANRYEGSQVYKDFRISNLKNYQAIIKKKNLDPTIDQNALAVTQLNLLQLYHLHMPAALAEFYWRLTLIISVPLMAFLVIPLSITNPRQGKLSHLFPALFFYLLYFLLSNNIKANAAKGIINPMVWFYLLNVIYLVAAFILNIWDSLFMRKLRSKIIMA